MSDVLRIEKVDVGQKVYGYKAFDFISEKMWAAVVGDKGSFSMISHAACIDLPEECKYPLLKFWDKNHVILVDSRIKRQGEINAWVISIYDGSIQTSFSVGDAVEDIVITDNYFVVTYFDEGLFGDITPSEQGIAVFDKQGAFVYGYADTVSGPIDIADCYAAAHVKGDEIVFFSYADFEIVVLDINTKEQIVFSPPERVDGAGQISCQQDNVFILVGPYDERDLGFIFDAQKGALTEFKLPSEWHVSKGYSQGRFAICSDTYIGLMEVVNDQNT